MIIYRSHLTFLLLLLPVLALADPQKQWTRIWGSGDYDLGYAASVDGAGNVYVAGATYGSFDGQTNAGSADLCVTKYGSDGTKLWTRIWGSATNDEGRAASVDSSGNVYVAGYTLGSFDGQTNAGGSDLCVTKFGSDGTKLWTRIWGSATNDEGRAVSVDGSGSVYVTGDTSGSFDGQTNAGSYDLCVTKFGSDGAKLWTRIWGSGDLDFGRAACVDSSGNVYVAGYTYGSFDGQTNAGNSDLCVTKHGSDGTKLWTRIWGSGGYDSGRAVSVDGSGNVYVAGETSGSFDGQTNAGSYDLCVTKYRSDGAKLWTRIWGSGNDDEGRAASVDSLGNVYVAGETSGSFDGQTNAGSSDLCVTKYRSDGAKLWTRIWGSGNDDLGRAASVDGSDNVYVVGYTYGLFDGQTNAGQSDLCLTKWHDPVLDADWDDIDDSWEISHFGDTNTANASTDYDGDGLRDILEFQNATEPKASDSDSDGFSDYVEVINNSDPNSADSKPAYPYKLWTRIWGSGDYDLGYAASVDGSGNVYVAGATHGSFDGQTNAGDSDLYVVKYEANGAKLWTRIWGSRTGDDGYAASVDSSGNVYVAGGTYGSFDGQTNAGGWDFCVTKYGPDGTKQWTRIWGSGSVYGDYGRAASVDGSGNVYVAGYTYGSFDGQTNTGSIDLCVTKYSSDGTKLWTRIWGSGSADYGYAACVDGSGNVYVAGETVGSFDGQTNAGGWDLCLTKYGSDGTKQWTRLWGSGSAYGDYAYAVSADGSGNVYVAGYTYGAFDGQTNAGNSGLCLTKYKWDGTKLWSRIWGSATNDLGLAASVDGLGNVYVAGYTLGSFDGQTNAGKYDLCLTKWVEQLPPSSNDDQDGDGLPDEWEILHFQSTNAVNGGRNEDKDADGVRNWAEYLAGTDPTNPASAFDLRINLSNGYAVLSYSALSATGAGYIGKTRTYNLEDRFDLMTGSWRFIADATNIVGSNAVITHHTLITNSVDFFRVRAMLK